ncbi:hypothetical protein RRG08_052952 [Elysia crispata]|uniref:Uncharacterized protein n=1 Tax=Elysia crispata TaxID=231223 RepID=A0AAE1DHC5_9GAST|nr:hypothetical protein RRG08_052952 [Elysia crispata]
MDPKVTYFRPASRDQSSNMDQARQDVSRGPLRSSRHARARQHSQESTVSIELTNSGGDKGLDSGGTSSGSKSVAFRAGPHEQYWNMAQVRPLTSHVELDLIIIVNC